MNRREMLATALGVCAMAKVSANVNVIDAEPPPLCLVIECDGDVTPEQAKMLLDTFKRMWKGPRPLPPVYVTHGGVKIKAIRDPGE